MKNLEKLGKWEKLVVRFATLQKQNKKIVSKLE